MRIGTWNLEGQWSSDHAQVMSEVDCDVWLLTEVRPRVILAGYEQHLSGGQSAEGRHWSGILSRRALVAEPDPDPASTAVTIDGQLFCASQLPWPLMPATAHWPGRDLLSRVEGALDGLVEAIGTRTPVWGGSWHQPLSGNIIGFSPRVQEAILAAVAEMALTVPTAGLTAAHGMQGSVDHIAIPATWELLEVGQADSPDASSESAIAWVDALRPRL